MSHKIQMNSVMKKIRVGVFSHVIPEKFKASSVLAKMPKQERAEQVYRLHLAGFKIAKMCDLFSISPSYQRELREMNEKDWQMRLLNDDEEFIQFHKTVSSKYVFSDDGNSKQDMAYCIILFENITHMVGNEPGFLIGLFDELMKMPYDDTDSVNQAKPQKITDVSPHQPINYIPEQKPISIQNEKGMMYI